MCSNCGHAEHIFGEGGAEKMCRDYDVPFLGEPAARHPHPRAGGLGTADGRRRSRTARSRRSIARSRARWRSQSRRRPRTSGRSSRPSSSRTRDLSLPRRREPDDAAVRAPRGRRPIRSPARDQVRQVDPPHGGAARDDRAVRARPGARGRRPPHRLLRHVELRLRHPLLATSSRSSPTSTRRSSIRRQFDAGSFVDFNGDVCIIPPNSFALARTVEYFRIPRNVLTICLGKSTYARCGIIVNVTPLEPEWEGYVTLEFSQHDAAAREDLRERGRRAGDLLRVRRGLRDVVQGPRRQVPGPAGRHAAEDLNAGPAQLLAVRKTLVVSCSFRRARAGPPQARSPDSIPMKNGATHTSRQALNVRTPFSPDRSKRASIAIIAICQVAAMALWFSASAVVPSLVAEFRLSGFMQAALTSGVQAGFVVGCLVSAVPRPRRPHRSAPLLRRVARWSARSRTRCCSSSIRRLPLRRCCASSPALRWQASIRSA